MSLRRVVWHSFVSRLTPLQANCARAARNAPALAILLALVWAPAFAGESPYGKQGGTWHYYCSSSQYQPKMYFTKAFDISTSPGTPDPDPMKIASAFQELITKKYNYTGQPVACFGNYKSLAEVQA